MRGLKQFNGRKDEAAIMEDCRSCARIG